MWLDLWWNYWILQFVWHFIMVGAIYTADLNHFLLIVFLFSFLRFVLVSIIIVVVSPFTFVVVFITLSLSRCRVFMFMFMFLEISPRGHWSSVSMRSPPLLWGFWYWVSGGVHLLSRCESRAFNSRLSRTRCARFSRALFACLLVCSINNLSPVLLSNSTDGNSFPNLEF